MTWSTSASGHHKTEEWREEEYELLRALVEVYEDDPATVVSNFNFNGNHVSVGNIEEAKTKLAEYDTEGEAPAEGETKEK
jgi:hypothetical protein